jgi:hypothetical protein
MLYRFWFIFVYFQHYILEKSFPKKDQLYTGTFCG